MKRVISLSETAAYQIRWALIKAIDMHKNFLMHADWDEGMTKAHARRVRISHRSLKWSLEQFDKGWEKRKLKRYFYF